MQHQTELGVKEKVISDNVLSISGGGAISYTKIDEDCASEPTHIDNMESDSDVKLSDFDVKLGECS